MIVSEKEPYFTAMFETQDDADTLACKRLLWAVIDRAIRDATNFRWNTESQDKRCALRWIRSDSQMPNSFLWTCEVLGTCPKKIREFCRTSSLVVYARSRRRVRRERHSLAGQMIKPQ